MTLQKQPRSKTHTFLSARERPLARDIARRRQRITSETHKCGKHAFLANGRARRVATEALILPVKKLPISAVGSLPLAKNV